MFGKKNPEVLVVGAGPVGMFAALVLTDLGVDVQIIDEEWETAAHSYALALHPSSLTLLGEYGLRKPLLDQAYPVERVSYYDGDEPRAHIDLQQAGSAGDVLAVVRQDALEEVLEKALRDRGVNIQWNHRASGIRESGNRVEVTVDRLEREDVGYAVAHTEWVVTRTRTMEVPFVIGADGHLSDVRRAAGIDFPSVGRTQYFAVFEFKSDYDAGHEMRVVLKDGTSNVVWPLPGGYVRWSFELTDSEVSDSSRMKDRLAVQFGAARYPVLSQDHLQRFIQERAPWFEGSIDQMHWQMVVRFERRLADRFGDGRLWLAGDSAHLTGPVGIQSMNVGLSEAKELASALNVALSTGPDDEQLQLYNRRREQEWHLLLGQQGAVRDPQGNAGWLFQNPADLLSSIPAGGDSIDSLLRQLGLEVA